jgi:hypothetical protein
MWCNWNQWQDTEDHGAKAEFGNEKQPRNTQFVSTSPAAASSWPSTCVSGLDAVYATCNYALRISSTTVSSCDSGPRHMFDSLCDNIGGIEELGTVKDSRNALF